MGKAAKIQIIIDLLKQFPATEMVREVQEIFHEVQANKWPGDTPLTFNLTVAQCQAIPNYMTNREVCADVLGAYLGRLTRHAASQMGLAIELITGRDMMKILAATDSEQRKALNILAPEVKTTH